MEQNLNELQKGEIRILKEYPDIIENIETLNLVLTPLEKWLFLYMVDKKLPATTRYIFSQTIVKLFYEVTSTHASQKPLKYSYLLYNFSEKRPYIDLDVRGKIREEFMKKNKPPTSITKTTGVIIKLLQKHNIHYPSYNKIESDLRKLESWGILRRRIDGKKVYWILNPPFYFKIKDKIKEILDKKLIQ